MRTTSRLIRTVLVAAGLLAISASAAQAMPSQAYKALDRSGDEPAGWSSRTTHMIRSALPWPLSIVSGCRVTAAAGGGLPQLAASCSATS